MVDLSFNCASEHLRPRSPSGGVSPCTCIRVDRLSIGAECNWSVGPCSVRPLASPKTPSIHDPAGRPADHCRTTALQSRTPQAHSEPTVSLASTCPGFGGGPVVGGRFFASTLRESRHEPIKPRGRCCTQGTGRNRGATGPSI